jgi:hypothetical protein
LEPEIGFFIGVERGPVSDVTALAVVEEGIRLVIANVEIREDRLLIQIHGRPAPDEVLEKLRAPGLRALRRSEVSTWLPGWMAQSATVVDQRPLTVRRRRANRSELRLRGG